MDIEGNDVISVEEFRVAITQQLTELVRFVLRISLAVVHLPSLAPMSQDDKDIQHSPKTIRALRDNQMQTCINTETHAAGSASVTNDPPR